jgi:DNA-binding IscR family transcriptional regulator
VENKLIRTPEKISIDDRALAEQIPDPRVVTEPEVKKLAHLPLLTIFYLSLQKRVSATPVTALEMAAYLGLDVKVVEQILSFLDGRGLVRAFRKDMPAYSLVKEFHEITAKDLIELLGEYQLLLKQSGQEITSTDADASEKKYRKIYSDLASEILQLFGQESINQLPL